ncbi:uncharacterized protein LOC130282519 isoform X2 [Hyla sarda]|uniref:uncharacterized protein LOC130282519 isoform X2 n=1 Tax=Hyla sarda TaxID=327740 RepID=UPI0024C2E77E|nr:uncharacterized protein LOC130282519 isoform X2 [Hyla sarda]
MEVNLIHQPLVSRDLSLNRRKERRTNMEDLIDVDGFKIQVKQKHLNLFLSINTFDTIKDLHLFARKLIFKKMFHSQSSSAVCSTREDLHTLQMLEELAAESNISNDKKWFPSTLTPRSCKFPPLSFCSNIDLFVQLVSRDIEKLKPTTEVKNCTVAQNRAIQELKQMKDVLFKPSDKGGNVVVWPSTLYEKEALRQLRDQNCYKKLTFNPTLKFQAELKDILLNAQEKGIISPKEVDYLLVKDPTVATFYLLPKIHKHPSVPPGRPIVSDTTDALRRLEGIHMDPDMMVVTCDVESLYTSIRHTDGMEAVKRFFQMSEFEESIENQLLQMPSFMPTLPIQPN